MSIEQSCPACGSKRLVPGVLQCQGGGFVPIRRKAKFFNIVSVYATACADCGFMQLRADTTKLNKVAAILGDSGMPK